MSKKLLTIVAGAAMAIAGPAFAQDNNGRQQREQARQNNQGRTQANPQASRRADENSVHGGNRNGQNMQDMRRQNSQGRPNASPQARERANANSAVQAGMEVRDQRGRRIGQVRDVRRAPDGTIIAIVVVLVVQVNNTNVITLPAGSFTIINNVVVVTNINLNIGS